jgi:hypothetical protein
LVKDLEYICLWKSVYDSRNSTTFKDMSGKDHPLYKCTLCEGTNKYCQTYTNINHYKAEKDKKPWL